MWFKFRNTPIHYNVQGEGPSVVLLHGFLESSVMWEPLLPEISKHHQVVTIDFPGLGQSGVVDRVHSMELMAEIVIAVMDHVNIDNATFIGHSMGGYVTLAITELFPNKVDKIVLLNSTSTPDSDERIEIRNRAIDLVQKNPKAFISMAIGNWAVASSRETFANEINSLKNQAYTFPLEGITAALRGMRDRKDRTEVLANFPRPKYMFLAEDDPIIPADKNIQLAKKAGVETKLASGGHMSLIENKPAVLNFIKKVL